MNLNLNLSLPFNLTSSRQRKFFALSYLEGFCYALMVATSESYALFFSVKKGLSYTELAMLTTLPLLIGALTQCLLPRFIDKRNIGRAVNLCQIVQFLGLLGVIYSAHNNFPFWPFLFSTILYWMGGFCGGPFWIDWMSGILPRSFFRPFLAKRNSFVVFSTLICYLSVSFVLQNFPGIPIQALFIIGACARFISILVQSHLVKTVKKKKYFLHSTPAQEYIASAEMSAESFKNILWPTFFWTGLFKMSVAISSPFFLPYMVKELHFSLWNYTLLAAMPMLGRVLFLRNWGRASYGYRPFMGLQIASLFISFIPLMWTVSVQTPYLMGLEFFSGIFWAGFELSTVLIIQNFVLQDSARIHGAHMAIMNVFSVIGSCIGAYLFRQKFSYEYVFYFSSFMRFMVAGLFILHISRRSIFKFRLRIYGDYLISILSFRPQAMFIGKIMASTVDSFARMINLRRSAENFKLRRREVKGEVIKATEVIIDHGEGENLESNILLFKRTEENAFIKKAEVNESANVSVSTSSPAVSDTAVAAQKIHH